MSRYCFPLVPPVVQGQLLEVRSVEPQLQGSHTLGSLKVWVPCFSSAWVAVGTVGTNCRRFDSCHPTGHHMRNQSVPSLVLSLDLDVLVALVVWEAMVVQ